MKPGHILLCLLVSAQISAQRIDVQSLTSISQVKDLIFLDKLSSAHVVSNLFLFTDKSVYIPNEIVWFSSYEFSSVQGDSLVHPLFVAISDRAQKKIVWSGRFAELNGFATGSFLIPDSIQDGNYALIAYTDRYIQGRKQALFYKNIYIRSQRKSTYTVIPYDNPIPHYGDTLVQRYLVTSLLPGSQDHLKINYLVYVDTTLVHQGQAVTNQLGEVTIKAKTDQKWIGKNVDLIISVYKDTIVKADLFPITFEQENTKAPFITILQDPALHKISIIADNLLTHQAYKLILFNEGGIRYYGQFEPKHHAETVQLSTDSLPIGNLNIALYNDQNENLAETSTFIQSNNVQITLKPDSTAYHPRSLVRIKIKYNNLNDRHGEGIISVSCALSRRIKDTTINNISKYYYPSSESRFIDAASSSFTGKVYYRNKKVSQKIKLALLGEGKDSKILLTDTTGEFKVAPDLLVAESQQPFVISVAGTDPEGYSLSLHEPDRVMNDQLKKSYFPSNLTPVQTKKEEDNSEIENSVPSRTLQTATVRHVKHDQYASLPNNFIDQCDVDAWVCSCGHWKCDGCPPKKMPVKGAYYLDGRTNRIFQYIGCSETTETAYLKQIEPLSVPPDFTPIGPNNVDQDANLTSTLYWNPRIELNSTSEKELQFYTSDLAGKYTLSIEGITSNGPIHQKIEFSVK